MSKKSQTNEILDVKSINLTTYLYKIITKVLSELIQGVLHETIHVSQGAFVQGR